MNKLALLILLALALAVCSCTGNTPSTTTTTTAGGTWEAELTGGAGPASGLSFTTAFEVRDVSGNNESLDITGFGFFNTQNCFPTGRDNESVAGTASFNTNTGTDQVTGTMTYNVQSNMGNTLVLTGTLNGTSNGTTTTTGNLTDGVVWGTWTLTGNATCTGGPASVSGNFIMCQGTSTCTIP